MAKNDKVESKIDEKKEMNPYHFRSVTGSYDKEKLEKLNLERYEKFMTVAIEQAKNAEKKDEVPIGAVIVYKDKILAKSFNMREKTQDATAHAEINCIRMACKKLNSWRLNECELYVTLEPCFMCAGAIINARIPLVVYGATNECVNAFSTKELIAKGGFNHTPKIIGGVLGDECKQVVKGYFSKKRKEKA